MESERLILWLAALAVFAVVNPVTGLDGRMWQEIVFVYGGFAAVAWALSDGGLLGAFSLWLLVSAAWHRGPESFNAVLMLLAFLGVVSLARRTGSGPAVMRWVVAANVAAFVLQVVGLWLPLLQLASPGASITIYNALHPHTGLTSSTADLACVLAIALPFSFVRRWWPIGAAGVVVLLWTSALSGIVAGIAALLVLAWPRIRAAGRGWLIGWGMLGLMATSMACQTREIASALSDDRWSAWLIALKGWFATVSSSLVGHGLGSWRHAGVYRMGSNGVPELWGLLHFDLLQLGYEAGMAAVVLVLAAWVFTARRTLTAGNLAALAGLVALAVCQFGHFPLHLASAGVVAALVVGEASHG